MEVHRDWSLIFFCPKGYQDNTASGCCEEKDSEPFFSSSCSASVSILSCPCSAPQMSCALAGCRAEHFLSVFSAAGAFQGVHQLRKSLQTRGCPHLAHTEVMKHVSDGDPQG